MSHTHRTKHTHAEKRKQHRRTNAEKNKARIRRWIEANRDRCRKYTRDWGKRNPQKKSALKHKINLRLYGLTPESYASLLAAQGGGCAICGATKANKTDTRRLAVDHDHSSGRVRGLLCTPCNRTLGAMNNDPLLLRKAADYLEFVWTTDTSSTA